MGNGLEKGRCLLSTSYVPGTIQGTGDTQVNKTKSLSSQSLHSGRDTGHGQYNTPDSGRAVKEASTGKRVVGAVAVRGVIQESDDGGLARAAEN